MSKLYPPYIEGKIPAQTGNILSIPFEMNRTVSLSSVKGIRCQIKTISTNTVKGILDASTFSKQAANFILDNETSLTIGQFYKIQLAYIDMENNVGHYSTVGVFKYTSSPELVVNGLSDNTTNDNLIVYEGYYTNLDNSEKEYSYSFSIYNDFENIYSSGELIHNIEEEVDKFVLPITLSFGVNYKLVYSITTINGLQVSKSYNIIDRVLSEVPNSFTGTLVATMNADEGTVEISFSTTSEISGRFRLLRFSNNTYDNIGSFVINKFAPEVPVTIYKDYTVQQGVEYKYALQQYSDKVYSSKLYSNKVFVDFEDMFLYDGKRQLKIKFNPKISSFKTTIKEAKIETLGGKFPFFFRNGNGAYKEFPLSGLVSMLSEENYFTSESFSQNDLVSQNIFHEREYKLGVLDWLNDGGIKLFRSATEGNYIVRLMNVSMSPNDTLGRMLHTFSCNAYEIMDNTFANLLEHQLVCPIEDIKNVQISQLVLKAAEGAPLNNTLYARIEAPKGTQVTLVFRDSSSVSITIGSTQTYEVPIEQDNLLASVVVESTPTEEDYVLVYYEDSSEVEYPILYNGVSIIGAEYQESAKQFAGSNQTIISEETNQLLSDEYNNFNIMTLSLNAKVTDSVLSSISLNQDLAGNLYTSSGVNTDLDCKVQIQFPGESEPTELDLTSATLYEDIEAVYPNRWRLESYGSISLTAEAFDDGVFRPTLLAIGNGVYANIYYSEVKYITQEASVSETE